MKTEATKRAGARSERPSLRPGIGIALIAASWVLGLDLSLRVLVSGMFTARTPAGRAVYELHGRLLTPRPGTASPAAAHITWHSREVFKGRPPAA